MDFEFPDTLKKVLADLVMDMKGNCPPDYPQHPAEREDAKNVQAVLRQLGHDVSLSDAAAIWQHYSNEQHAGWLTGAETISGAASCLKYFCEELAG